MKKISVTFINHEDDMLLGTFDIPADKLPQAFNRTTTLHIAGDNWLVIEAAPLLAAEFTESGKLRLRVQFQEISENANNKPDAF